MVSHLIGLLIRSFHAVPTALGSTWLGLLFPLWGFIVSQLVILLRDGWQGMKTHWKENLIRGFAVAGLAWASLFAWCVITTTYQDHEALASRVGTLRKSVDSGERDKRDAVLAVQQPLTAQLSDLKLSCAETKGANGALENQNKDQQGTINNCQTQALKLLTPEPFKMTPLLLSNDTSNSVAHTTTFLLLTNATVTPVRMRVLCNERLDSGRADIVGSGTMAGGTGLEGPNALDIAIDEPAWSPISPLRLVVQWTSGKSDIQCGFERR